MIEPYEDGPRSPTIRSHLSHAPGWIWACRWQCACMKAIPLAPYIERYGLDIRLDELRMRMRCLTCDDHPTSFSIATMGRRFEGRFPPIDRVPETMRGYATVDPLHLPAPLRGD